MGAVNSHANVFQRVSLQKAIEHTAQVCNMIDKGSSVLSQLFHYLAYSIRKPKMRLEKGMLIVSVDVDVGIRELGVINRGENDANVNKSVGEYRVGEIEELAFPLFLELFNHLEIPVTFALRGQMLEADDSLLRLLLKSNVEHDIGAHGYHHRHFTNLSRNEAENELNLISMAMKRFAINPRSFVFPAGKVAHLDLLEKYAYKCYRGYGDFINDCMYVERKGKLYNIHPSLYLDHGTCFAFLRKFLDISVSNRLPFHIWFHLWHFGETETAMKKIIKNVFLPFFNYARTKESTGVLSFETMLSAALKVQNSYAVEDKGGSRRNGKV